MFEYQIAKDKVFTVDYRPSKGKKHPIAGAHFEATPEVSMVDLASRFLGQLIISTHHFDGSLAKRNAKGVSSQKVLPRSASKYVPAV